MDSQQKVEIINLLIMILIPVILGVVALFGYLLFTYLP